MKKEYKSQIYNTLKAFLYSFPLFISGFVLLIFISVQLKSDLLIIFGSICLFISPFIFQKNIRNIFTRKVLLEFDEQAFIVTEFPLKKDTIITKSIFNWADIKSYKVDFTKLNYTNLTIYLKDGSNKTFGFKDKNTFEEALKEEGVFNIFYSYVKQYNADKEINKKITLTPVFFTTRSGSFILFSVVGLAIFAVCFHIYKAPKSSPFTLLMGVSIILGLLGKRKQDKDNYNRINNLG